MLNSKKIHIGGKDVTVTEVKVKRILQLLPFTSAGQKGGKAENEDEVTPGFMDHLQELLHETCGMTQEDLEDLHLSELEQLWAAFREVNAFFFKTIAQLGLEQTIKDLLNTLLSAYGGMFASLLSGVTLDASNMDLAGLLGQEKIPTE